MELSKSSIAVFAIREYVRMSTLGDCFRTNSTCGFCEYAFTKDLSQAKRDDIEHTMRCIEATMGLPEMFFPNEMRFVTRDVEMWDK